MILDGIGDVQECFKLSVYEMEMMIQIYIMTATGAYVTMMSIPSSMKDPYVQVLEYRSY